MDLRFSCHNNDLMGYFPDPIRNLNYDQSRDKNKYSTLIVLFSLK